MSASAARLPRMLAGTLALAGVAVVVGTTLIWGADGFRPLPTSFARSVPGVAIGMVASLCYLGVGWLLASRHPRNPIGWLLLGMGIVLASMTPIALLVEAANQALRPAPSSTLMLAWLFSSFGTPSLAAMGLIAGLLFPDGRLIGPGWRWAVLLSLVAAGLIAVAEALEPTGLVWYATLPNPFAAPASFEPLLSAALVAGILLLLTAVAVLLVSLARRYRRGDAIVRAQTRWVVFAAAVQGATFIPFALARYVIPVSDTLGELLLAVTQAGSAILPIAGAVAITRYRLFGIDFVIRRTLVYVPLMAILGGLYTASVAIFQRIFVALTGGTSDAALVMTIFLVATAFTPVRKGLEGAVDRWIRGGEQGASSHDTVVLAPELVRVASEIIALRQLEERLARGGAKGDAVAEQRRLPIDQEGRVSCPAGGSLNFVGCLGCRNLTAVIVTPPAIVCTGGLSSAVD